MEEMVSILKRLDKALDAGHQEMLDSCYTGCHQKSLDYIFFFKKVLGCFEKEILAQGLSMRAESAIKSIRDAIGDIEKQCQPETRQAPFEKYSLIDMRMVYIKNRFRVLRELANDADKGNVGIRLTQVKLGRW